MAHWALSFGAPDDVLAALYQGGAAGGVRVAPVARGAHTFWLSVVELVAQAWVYSYFWTSAAIIYLVLRRDVDGTPWHVIAAPERRPFEFSAPETTEESPPPGVPGTTDAPESFTPKEPVAPDAPAHSGGIP
jgi:hypothetical protein